MAGYHVLEQVLFTIQDYLWMWGILQMGFVKNKKRLAAGGILFTAFLVWEGCVGFGDYAAIFEMVFGAVLATILFAGKVAEVQLKFWFTIFSMDIISGPISLGFHIAERYMNMSWWEKYSDVLYELILIVVFVVVVCTIRKNMELRRKIDGFPCHYFVIGILVCICTSMLRVFVYSFGEGQTMAVQNVSEILSVCLNEGIYLLGISLIIINEYRLQYRDESLMKSEYIGMLKEYHRMQDRHMKEVHKIRHDMKNHMMIVGEYLEQEKWDEAKAYLAQMEDVASWERKQLIDVGNDVVSAVFSMEREQAGDEIVFQCEGHVSEKVAISDYDLCTIFSNLLSNAREACERLQRKEKRIEILLKEYQKQMLVTIKNPIEWEVDIEKLGTYTSKEDGEVHGYGISNVMEAVARYDGEIWFDVRDGMFTVSVKI